MRKILALALLAASATALAANDRSVVELKDGGKIMMKNDAIWKQITEHGTLKPGHS